MSFKVGDKIRLIGMTNEEDYYKKYLGEIFTIKEVEDNFVTVKEDVNIAPYFQNIELVKEYTYEDLKKSPIGTKITFENGEVLVKDDDGNYSNKKRWRDDSDLKELKDRINTLGKIIKIEEPEYKTVYEAKLEILDEVEKRYLRGVIRPFEVRFIKKVDLTNAEYIYIELKSDHISLPNFSSNTMYKGMEIDKKYTLEELGL